MNLEHRLQHAARELREVTIDVPPLERAVHRRRTSLVPALAAPLLFAAGALFAVGAVRGVERPMNSDIRNSDISVTSNLADDPVGTSVADPIGEPVIDVAPAAVDPLVVDPSLGTDNDTDVAAPTIQEELAMISEFLSTEPPSRTTETLRSSTGTVGTVVLGPI